MKRSFFIIILMLAAVLCYACPETHDPYWTIDGEISPNHTTLYEGHTYSWWGWSLFSYFEWNGSEYECVAQYNERDGDVHNAFSTNAGTIERYDDYKSYAAIKLYDNVFVVSPYTKWISYRTIGNECWYFIATDEYEIIN